MTYYFNGECHDDILLYLSVKMAYHFSEESHDDILFHWRV